MPFDLQPILQGDLVHLRPLQINDFDALYAVASDPLIWQQHPCSDRYKLDIFQEFFRQAIESHGAFLIFDRKTNQVIGSSRYHDYDEAKSQIEIGWTFLARSHWGGSFNRDLKHLMLNHAFRFVKSVVFLVGPKNFRSQKALEKLGAVRIGSRVTETGDNVVYQITAPKPA